MDTKTAVFKKIECDIVTQLIKSTSKKTNPVVWGRLLQHCRECNNCFVEFMSFHQSKIGEIVDGVVNLKLSVEHCNYTLSYELEMCFSKELLAEYFEGNMTNDEKELIGRHLNGCYGCMTTFKKLKETKE